MSEKRKLAAILAADVVGYSRLASEDEDRTLARLRALRSDLIDPTISVHNGRVIKRTGDGALVEFRSVVDAVRCAIEVQNGMIERNAGVPQDRRIDFRIGVHLGDVVEESDGDLMGDGVNIASRLEGLAAPGSICLSEDAYRQVKARLDLSVTDLGNTPLKNIAEPMRVYSLQVGTPERTSQLATSRRNGSTPPKLSIAVLPLVSMSDDAEQTFFTDGLTEDIITDLSNVPGFFVIARNSSFAYKGMSTDVRQIAHDLGVRYLLEGSARRSAERLRINVQLIDAAGGGNHIWAERFDRDLADIFAVQDEVTRRVVEAISGKLSEKYIVSHSRPSNLEAYDLCVRSRGKWNISRSDSSEACADLERAIQIDPNYCEAHSNLAMSLLFGWIIWGVPQIPGRAKALMHAQRAVEIDPGDSHARRILGCVQLYERNWDEAKLQFDAAVRQNPNNADAVAWMSELQVYLGKPQAALITCAEALRLNPHPPGWYFWTMGLAQISSGYYEEAVASLSREETYGTGSKEHLIAALALAGRVSEAQEEARLFLAANPDWKIADFMTNFPFKSMTDAEPFIEGWRRAGMPE
ncbi:adenylate/guanylate cyclase domain-containing protein [Mesorhizobium sp. M2D.F.Ca.ET.223.01.1.1]|uniref:adenylate/guanylate cyclase domain-containing protein n=1 Tax=Mesorhizobium sp. M2D.F.Ca.ET.223.01.1.1 TaxID=2563940 RepID=UPI001091ED3F|nr:adenylate/guanylate cyclase domain-containing protein [Mesorhizobium sp. M2D.F.Ca.ET.223.01.1.1]TGP86377.1 adenylate/guanylate cyclase domain-containing protein [bacterium M00.F.Ca.ET.221.01.1.1]TGR88719.1 adenylate/guanylate cyclase domain-containing protein [Mesorhizobium sp. M2D.F.Ca.ET.223.01.1.1]TGT72972.1 adenylate/guanylate cyclase domain-containing protein [bacterium M00.F.Ca.ET.159.01.1.1]